MLKLLLNVFTAEIEALVQENKFLHDCELNHVLTPSSNSSLFLKRCDLNQFFR
jgi:hypothetical protein